MRLEATHLLREVMRETTLQDFNCKHRCACVFLHICAEATVRFAFSVLFLYNYTRGIAWHFDIRLRHGASLYAQC